MRDLSPRKKGNTRLTKMLGRLSYKKIQRYNNLPPYMMARWLPQQIPPLNFLGKFPIKVEFILERKHFFIALSHAHFRFLRS